MTKSMIMSPSHTIVVSIADSGGSLMQYMYDI